MPFLSKKNQDGGIAGVIIKKRQSDEPQIDSGESEHSLSDCAKDIMAAIQANDHEALASALKEAFQKLDSEPHEEGPHIEPHSYDAQKEE